MVCIICHCRTSHIIIKCFFQGLLCLRDIYINVAAMAARVNRFQWPNRFQWHLVRSLCDTRESNVNSVCVIPPRQRRRRESTLESAAVS